MRPLDLSIFLLEKGLNPLLIAKQAELVKVTDENPLLRRNLLLIQKDFPLMEKLCQASRTPPFFWIEEMILRSVEGKKLAYPLQTAILTALFTPLRQSIGSCFATACAIYVQYHKGEQLVLDLIDLLTKGAFKRMVGESPSYYPLCPAENVLKGWEYTIASLSGNSNQLLRFNLSETLGLRQPQEPLSFGSKLQGKTKEIFDRLQEEIQQSEKQISLEQDQLDFYEQLTRQQDVVRAKRASSFADVQAHNLSFSVEKAEKIKAQLSVLETLQEALCGEIESQLEFYFAELYDPSLATPPDERAGFVLHFKSKHSALGWKKIDSGSLFLELLSIFLSDLESELASVSKWHQADFALQEIFAEWQNLLRDPFFIEEAKKRLEKAHERVCLETKVLSPWSYLSGGTFHALLETYFGQKFHEKKIEASSALDIVNFLAEFMKDVPGPIFHEALNDPDFHLFLSMPGHAMLFWPSCEPFKSLWSERRYISYTPIRDTWLFPSDPKQARILTFADTNWEKNRLSLFLHPLTQKPALGISKKGEPSIEPLEENLVIGCWRLYFPFQV